MNLIDALRKYTRVAATDLPYGWFAYDENGILFRYGISGSKAECVCCKSLLEKDNYIEFKPELKVVTD